MIAPGRREWLLAGKMAGHDRPVYLPAWLACAPCYGSRERMAWVSKNYDQMSDKDTNEMGLQENIYNAMKYYLEIAGTDEPWRDLRFRRLAGADWKDLAMLHLNGFIDEVEYRVIKSRFGNQEEHTYHLTREGYDWAKDKGLIKVEPAE